MKDHVNLLPFKYRRRELLRRRLLQWSLVWIACTTVAAGFCWSEYSRYRRSQAAMEAAARAYLPLETLIRQRDASRSQLRRLHAKGTILGHLREERPVLALMGVASESARKCNGRLVVRDLLLQRRDTAAKTDPPKAAKPQKKRRQPLAERTLPWATVTFQGDALDNLAIATFAAGLRDSGLFRRVELKSSLSKKSAEAALHAFVVQCEI